MCHLVGVVVQSYNGFPLLYARQYYHQSSVSHHQVQVVLGQVKVHSLGGDTNTYADYIIFATSGGSIMAALQFLDPHMQSQTSVLSRP